MMDNCCTCTNTDTNSIKINTIITKNGVSIKTQLENLVPEVIWLEHYVICSKCQDTLLLIHAFHTQCLESQKLRCLEIKVEPDIADDDSNPPSPLEPLNSNKLILDDDPLKATTSTPTNERTRMCTYCGKTFKKQTDLTTHEKTHLNKREYECKLCQKQFNTYGNLHTHNLVKHTAPEKWRFHCDICNKRFPMKSNYVHHQRRHNNIREHICHLCEKKFKDKFSLKNHIELHSNCNLLNCDVCGLEYKRKVSLDLHKFKVHQIGNVKVPIVNKKYTCEVCGKAFVTNAKLQRHLRTHIGERPLKCPLCENRFREEKHVKRHIYRMHNKIEK